MIRKVARKTEHINFNKRQKQSNNESNKAIREQAREHCICIRLCVGSTPYCRRGHVLHASSQLGGRTATDFPLADAAGPRLSETSPPGGAARADNTAVGTEGGHTQLRNAGFRHTVVVACKWWGWKYFFKLSLLTNIELYKVITKPV